MIRMIMGRTMIGRAMSESVRVRNHSAHSIRKIMVPDDGLSRTLGSLRDSLLPKLMRGEVRIAASQDN